jgi:L-rhamnose-H+ transport protein
VLTSGFRDCHYDTGVCAFPYGRQPRDVTVNAETTNFALLAASGVFQACFALPMKQTRYWRWEQIWVAQSVTANLLFPLCWALLVPGIFWVEAGRIPISHWLSSYCWGLLWGAGGVTYGLTLARLGMAVANAFIIGVTLLAGALLPLTLNAVESPAAPTRFAVGLLLSLAGTALLGLLTTNHRPKSILAMPFSLEAPGKIVAVAVISGLLSAGYGLAFTFQYRTVDTLIAKGISPLTASLAVLLPVYVGGASVAIPTGIYAALKCDSLPLFLGRGAARNWLLAIMMGLFAAGTAVCYNLGSTSVGHPPPNVAFAIFMTFLVLGGVVLGFATGEMRGDRLRAKAITGCSAMGLLIAAWLLNSR